MGSEWREAKLGDVATVEHGFAFGGDHFRDEGDGPYIVTPGNFRIGGGFNSHAKRTYVGPCAPGYVLAPGDLVVTMTDLSKAGDTLGYAALVPKDGEWLHNQRVGKLHLRSHASARLNYLHWLLRSPAYRAEILGSATGSTVRHTSPSRIEAFRFRLPSISEQDAIADLLGALDDKIELNRRMAETLVATARVLFKSWFVDFDPVHAKAKGRLTVLPDDVATLFPDRLTDDGLPEGWTTAPLLDFFDLVSGGTPRTSVQDYWGGDIPWFSVVDAPASGPYVLATERTLTAAGLANCAATLLPENATIITARGTVGKLALVGRPMAMNQSCYAAISNRGLGPFFTFFLIQSGIAALRAQTHGSVFDTITRSTFGGVTAPKPSLPLAAAFETAVTPLMARTMAAAEQIIALSTLRDTLLPKLISGELRITETERAVAAA